MKDIAIIILNYITWKETLKEVELCRDILGIEYKNIIVVDNNSPNESYNQLKSFSKDKFVLIKNNENLGYAAGNNIGLKYAKKEGYKYGFILNNDILFEDYDLVSKMKDVFKKNENIAIVSPKVLTAEKKLYNYDVYRPEFWDFSITMPIYKKRCKQIVDLGNYGIVYRPQGCCMLLDLDKLDEVGYLDEGTFLYCEEIIIAERLLSKKYLCAICLNAEIVHNHSTTVKDAISKTNILKIINKSLSYYLKEYRHYNEFQIFFVCMINKLKYWLHDSK